jgi:hypothetical protein
MYCSHSAEEKLVEKLVEKLLPHLKNILVTHDGHIAHFCSFCQTNGRKENGRKWSESKRKGYLLLANTDKHQKTVFYCHNDRCSSRSLVNGRKAIPLDVYAGYVVNHCFKDEGNSDSPRMAASGTSTTDNSRGFIGHQPMSNLSRFTVIKLPSYTPQQQSSKGGHLDKRIDDRKNRQKCLWAGYADRKAGKPWK